MSTLSPDTVRRVASVVEAVHQAVAGADDPNGVMAGILAAVACRRIAPAAVIASVAKRATEIAAVGKRP